MSYPGITHVFCEIMQCVGGVTVDNGRENRADGDGTVGRMSEVDGYKNEDEDEEIEMEARE